HAGVEVELGQLAAGVQRRVVQRPVAVGVAVQAGVDIGFGVHGSPCIHPAGAQVRVSGFAGALPADSRDLTRAAPKWQEKVLPTPTALRISSRAWCRCSACLTIASPRPVPPLSRERLAETR